MTIGEVIREYREKNGISQRQFAIKCNISNGYVSMLEKGINPKTNEPIMPSISALKAISSAMGLPLHELMILADDMPIDLSKDAPDFIQEKTAIGNDDGRAMEFAELFNKLSAEQQELIIASIKGILSNQ